MIPALFVQQTQNRKVSSPPQPLTETCTRGQLLPAYPNPFNPETWIPFDLAVPAPVEMVIYNDLGRATRSISLGQLPAGGYRTRERAAHWDGRNDAGERVASGAYFIEIRAGPLRQTRRVTLAK